MICVFGHITIKTTSNLVNMAWHFRNEVFHLRYVGIVSWFSERVLIEDKTGRVGTWNIQ